MQICNLHFAICNCFPQGAYAPRSDSASFLQDGKVVVWHLQDDTSHGGGVVTANIVVPRAVGRAALAVGEQLLANEGEPLGPVGAAGGPHGLDGVIVPVEVVNIGTAEGHVISAVAVFLAPLTT